MAKLSCWLRTHQGEFLGCNAKEGWHLVYPLPSSERLERLHQVAAPASFSFWHSLPWECHRLLKHVGPWLTQERNWTMRDFSDVQKVLMWMDQTVSKVRDMILSLLKSKTIAKSYGRGHEYDRPTLSEMVIPSVSQQSLSTCTSLPFCSAA